MPYSIEKNHLMWESVREEDDLAKAIKMTTEIGEEAIKSSIEDRIQIREDISAIKRTVVGNGDPTHSIIARVEALEERIRVSCGVVEEIRKLLVGDLSGRKDSVSDKVDDLSERISKLEAAMGSISKLTWVVILAVVGEVLARVFNLF